MLWCPTGRFGSHFLTGLYRLLKSIDTAKFVVRYLCDVDAVQFFSELTRVYPPVIKVQDEE